ncbi:hypothetical protein HDU98_004132, partial [Podochytrium sp. JEL0797]
MTRPNRPPFPFHTGTDLTGFAHPTVVNRWPIIVTDVINAILKTQDRSAAEANKVIALLSRLKYEITRDKPFSRLLPTTPNATFWNESIELYFPTASFLSASWLFSECYLYQRIHEAVESQDSWKGFDYFADSKMTAFRDLAGKVGVISENQHLLSTNHTPLEFNHHLRDLLLLSLWGNATDLSMFAGLSDAQVEEMRSGAVGEENIISNHLDEVVDYVE